MDNVPCTDPACASAKVTVVVQLRPGAGDVPQLLDSANMPVLVVMFLMGDAFVGGVDESDLGRSRSSPTATLPKLTRIG